MKEGCKLKQQLHAKIQVKKINAMSHILNEYSLNKLLVWSNFTGLTSASSFGAIHSQSSSENFSIYKHHWKNAELQLSVPDDTQQLTHTCDTSSSVLHTPIRPHTHTLNEWQRSYSTQSDWKNTGEQRLCCPSTLEGARWCSWASGRRNEQSCWCGSSSPPQTLAAGTQRPPTGARRAGWAEPHRGRAAESLCDPATPRNQKGRKRIQRRCDTCGCAHVFIMQTGYQSHTKRQTKPKMCKSVFKISANYNRLVDKQTYFVLPSDSNILISTFDFWGAFVDQFYNPNKTSVMGGKRVTVSLK